MLDNCFRFAPRDSIPGLIAKICKYLKDHPGWSEAELEVQINKFISATVVESFNGRTGTVTLDKNDVNNLKIASVYFAEGNESIDSLDLVSLYNQGVRFVFTNFNSVTSGYNLAFVLDYFGASGEVVYYPVSTGSGSSGNIVSVNGKTGAVNLKVVDVSNGNSPDENAYIFIDESDDYPDVISSDSSKLGGQLPSYYASTEEVSQLKGDLDSITPDRFYKDNKSNSIDITNLATVNANKYIGGANVVGSTIALSTNYDYKVYELSANNIVGYIKYKRFKPAAIHLCITNESDVILALANNKTLDNWAQNIGKPTWIEVSGVYSTDTETFVEINIDLAKSVLNEGDNIKIWIASTTTDDETVCNILTYHYEYSDLKWLGKIKNENMDNDSVDTAQIKQLSITYEKLNADVRTKLVDYKGSIVMPSVLILPSSKVIDFHYANIFRNVNPDNLNYVSISRGSKYDGFTRYSFSSSDTDFTAIIAGYLASETGSSYQKNISVKIAKNVASNKKILFIGDSITAQGAYIGKLSEMYSDFTFLGTLLTTGVDNEYSGTPCEGRSGWAAYNYCNNASFSGYTNPFYNGGFDFSYYMQKQGYSDVDIVFINLGTNDPVRGDGTITQMLSCYNQMINSIKSFNSSIKIMLWLPTARAIAYNSLHSGSSKALERNEALISEFDNKQNENIILIPVNCCVDPYRDYHFTESVASQYNSDVVRITTDPIHPSLAGHKKMADLIYGYINYYN